MARREGCVVNVTEQRTELSDTGFAVVRLRERAVHRLPPGYQDQSRDHERPGHHRGGHRTQREQGDGGHIDRRQHETGDPWPSLPPKPGIALGPAKEAIGRRIGVTGIARGHKPTLRRQPVAEVQRPGHLKHRLLAQRDLVRVSAPEHPCVQRVPAGGGSTHTKQLQQGSVPVQVEVDRVVVVPRGRGAGHRRQVVPPPLDPRDPLAVEVTHEFAAPHPPSGGPLSRDEDPEHKRGRGQHQPRRPAALRCEQPPSAHHGRRENGQPQPPVHTDPAETLGCFYVEPPRALRVGGCG